MTTLEKNQRRLIFFFGLSAFLVGLDQLTKRLIEKNLALGEVFPVLPEVLEITLSYNTGAAFGLFSSGTGLLTIISGLACLYFIFWLVRSIETLSFWGKLTLSLLLAGALGNLIDRLLFGRVTDFIDLLLLPGNFPIFNLADLWINLGALIYIISSLAGRFERKTESL